MKSALFAILLAVIAAPLAAQQSPNDQGTNPAAQAAPLADGEIRRIDRDAQKITIRHGPIPSLNMPAMSMVFQVSDPALLDRAKPGDKVKFSAVQDRGAYVVTRIEPAP